MRSRLAALAAALAISAACTRSGSPTSATTVTLADFNGQFSGTYNISSCVADGTFAGFCDAGGFTNGMTLPITLSLTQSQSTVTGSVTLGGITGTFQGTVSGSTLSGTATMNVPTDASLTLTLTIMNWTTTISGNSLSGTFKLVFRQPSSSGSATISATIMQLNR